MLKVNAVWATISVALSKLIKVAVLCPTGNENFDEQAAAKFGVCREGNVYEDFSEDLLAETLNDLEKFTAEWEGPVRYAPNILNREVQAITKVKPRKSSLRYPAKTSKPSSARRGTVPPFNPSTGQEIASDAPKVVCLGAGRTALYTPLPPLPDLPPLPPSPTPQESVPSTVSVPPTAPTANTSRASRLRAKFPGDQLQE